MMSTIRNLIHDKIFSILMQKSTDKWNYSYKWVVYYKQRKRRRSINNMSNLYIYNGITFCVTCKFHCRLFFFSHTTFRLSITVSCTRSICSWKVFIIIVWWSIDKWIHNCSSTRDEMIRLFLFMRKCDRE